MARSYLVAFLFSLSLLVLDRLGWLGLIKGPLEFGLVLPIRQYVYERKLNLNKRLAFIREGQKLNEQLQRLQEEKALLEAENLRCHILERENQAMRLLLAAPLPPESEFILVHVLAFASGELLLAGGKESGVKIGKEVVVENNLIGYIFQVEANLSRARLLYHAQSRVSAAVINKAGEKATGILRGQFGTKMRLTEILQAQNFNLGDRVVTAAVKTGLNNLLIGEVVKIDKTETALYQEAEVESFVDVSGLEVVFVVK